MKTIKISGYVILISGLIILTLGALGTFDLSQVMLGAVTTAGGGVVILLTALSKKD